MPFQYYVIPNYCNTYYLVIFLQNVNKSYDSKVLSAFNFGNNVKKFAWDSFKTAFLLHSSTTSSLCARISKELNLEGICSLGFLYPKG